MRLTKPKPWEWLVCAGIVILLGGIFWPITGCACSKAAGPRTACLSGIKQIGIGIQMYASDWNERLPNRDSWMDDIDPYLKSQEVLRDPVISKKAGYGRAYDSRLSLKEIKAFSAPDKQPLIFDSINLRKNASDPFLSLPKPGRHGGRNVIGYLDGSAKSVAVAGGS